MLLAVDINALPLCHDYEEARTIDRFRNRVMRRVFALSEQVSANQTMIAFDHPDVGQFWRRDYFAQYLSQLERLPINIVRALYLLVNDFSTAGAIVSISPRLESRDLVAIAMNTLQGEPLSVVTREFCAGRYLVERQQLIDPRGGWYVDAHKFFLRHGVALDRVLDFAALTGRVHYFQRLPKCSDKTARLLLKQFQDVESIIHHAWTRADSNGPLTEVFQRYGETVLAAKIIAGMPPTDWSVVAKLLKANIQRTSIRPSAELA